LPVVISAQIVPATAERTLTIRARDSVSNSPLGSVAIARENSTLMVITDSAGAARIRIAASGETRLTARLVGFSPALITVRGAEPGDSLTVLLARAAPAQALPGVEVRTAAGESSSRFADFDRRRLSRRSGVFISRAELEKHDGSSMVELLRRYPSLRIVDSLGVKLVASSRGNYPTTGLKGFDPTAPCVLRVMIDGAPLPAYFDVSEIQLKDIHGIEAYAGPASIPVEFAGMVRGSQCGMIAIWTNSR